MMNDSFADENPVEVLAAEFAERRRRGEHPSIAEYAERHPELAEFAERFPRRADELRRRLEPSQAAVETSSPLSHCASSPSRSSEKLAASRCIRSATKESAFTTDSRGSSTNDVWISSHRVTKLWACSSGSSESRCSTAGEEVECVPSADASSRSPFSGTG